MVRSASVTASSRGLSVTGLKNPERPSGRSVAKKYKPRQKEAQTSGECPRQHAGEMLRHAHTRGVTQDSEYNRTT